MTVSNRDNKPKPVNLDAYDHNADWTKRTPDIAPDGSPIEPVKRRGGDRAVAGMTVEMQPVWAVHFIADGEHGQPRRSGTLHAPADTAAEAQARVETYLEGRGSPCSRP